MTSERELEKHLKHVTKHFCEYVFRYLGEKNLNNEDIVGTFILSLTSSFLISSLMHIRSFATDESKEAIDNDIAKFRTMMREVFTPSQTLQ